MNKFEQGLRRYLTEKQLKRIQTLKIGIGGAGGLGSNLAVMLVRSGFKHLEILDRDIIEPSNLNRQYYFLNELGQSKVKVLKARLLKINPDLKIKIDPVEWSEKNGKRFFKGCDFVAEAFDQAKIKRNFVEFYQSRTNVLVSGCGMAGICVKKEMKVKKIGNVYIVGDRITDTAKGHPPMAPRVTACAAKMAEIILDLSLKSIR